MPLTLKGLLDPEGPTLGLLLDESKLEQGTDDLVPFLTISSPTVDPSELTLDTEDLVLLLLLLLGPKPVNFLLDTSNSKWARRILLLLLLRGPKPVNLLLDMSTLRLGTEDPVLLLLVLLMALKLGLGGHATHPQGPS